MVEFLVQFLSWAIILTKFVTNLDNAYLYPCHTSQEGNSHEKVLKGSDIKYHLQAWCIYKLDFLFSYISHNVM